MINPEGPCIVHHTALKKIAFFDHQSCYFCTERDVAWKFKAKLKLVINITFIGWSLLSCSVSSTCHWEHYTHKLLTSSCPPVRHQSVRPCLSLGNCNHEVSSSPQGPRSSCIPAREGWSDGAMETCGPVEMISDDEFLLCPSNATVRKPATF